MNNTETSRLEHWYRLAKPIVLMLFLAVTLTSCYGVPDEMTRKGRALMETYLASRGSGKFLVNNVYRDLDRVAADTVVATDYVHGEYTIDGEKFEFWIDMTTETIFTSENKKELERIGVDLMTKRLGLDPAACSGVSTLGGNDSPRPMSCSSPIPGNLFLKSLDTTNTTTGKG